MRLLLLPVRACVADAADLGAIEVRTQEEVMKKLVFFVLFTFAVSAVGFADNVLYTQTFDQTGNGYSSQNDVNGFGLFAQVYDNFSYTTAAGSYTVTGVEFTGVYFNPPAQGPITGWTVSIYGDAGGPGSVVYTTQVAGTGNETFLGVYGGFPAYTYSLATNFTTAVSGTTYWLSVVPDLGFPPQWGWTSAFPGDGISYQDFEGVRSPLAVDMAFTVIGFDNGPGVPEPGTLVMVGTGFLGLAGAMRRKLF
jgi:hypothetical protein